jgi:hypothetical protein
MSTDWHVIMIVTNTQWSKTLSTEFPCQGNTASVSTRCPFQADMATCLIGLWFQNEHAVCPLGFHYQQQSVVPFNMERTIHTSKSYHSRSRTSPFSNDRAVHYQQHASISGSWRKWREIVRPLNCGRSGPALHVIFLKLELGPIEMMQITIHTPVQ